MAPFAFPAVLLVLSAFAGVLASSIDNSIRTVKFSATHIERLPLNAIERLRSAVPLTRPLDSDAYAAVRSSLRNISNFDASSISNLAIDTLQGRYERKQWGAGYIDITGIETVEASKVVGPAPAAVTAPAYPTVDSTAHPELTPMLAMVTAAEIKGYVNTLSTTYVTRYYKSTIARRK